MERWNEGHRYPFTYPNGNVDEASRAVTIVLLAVLSLVVADIDLDLI